MAGSEKRHVHVELVDDMLQIATDNEVYHISVNPPSTRLEASAPPLPAETPAAPPARRPDRMTETLTHLAEETEIRTRPSNRRIEEMIAEEQNKAPQSSGLYPADLEDEELYDLLPEMRPVQTPCLAVDTASSDKIYRLLTNLTAQLADAVKGMTADSDLGPTASTVERLDALKIELGAIRRTADMASRDVINVGGRLRSGLDEARRLIDVLASARPVSDDKTNEFRYHIAGLVKAHRLTAELLDDGLNYEQEAVKALNEILRGVIAKPKARPKAKAAHFPIGDLFQVLHELAANSRTRKAVQVVWDGLANFDLAQADQQLRLMSADFAKEEGLLLVPLDKFFEVLSATAKDNQYRRLVDKLAADRGQLFTDQMAPVVLPLNLNDDPDPIREEEIPQPAHSLEPELAARLAAARDKLTIHLDRARSQADKSLGFKVDQSMLALLKSSALISGLSRAEMAGAVNKVRNLADDLIPDLAELADSLSFQDRAVELVDRAVTTVADIHLQLIRTLVSLRNDQEVLRPGQRLGHLGRARR